MKIFQIIILFLGVQFISSIAQEKPTWNITKGPIGVIYSLSCEKNKIVAGTAGEGVFISLNRGDSWKNLDNGLIKTPVQNLLYLDDSTLIAGTSNGLYQIIYKSDSLLMVNPLGLTNQIIYSIVIYSKEELLIATTNGIYKGGLKNFEDQYWEPFNQGLSSYIVYSLEKDAAGNVYAGTVAGLFKLNKDNWDKVAGLLEDKEITSLHYCNGQILVGTWGHGVFSQDTLLLNCQALGKQDNKGILKNQYVTKVTSDSIGNIFAATQSDGIFTLQFNNNKYQGDWIALNEGLQNKNVCTLIVSDWQDIFAGTYGSGIFRRLKPVNTVSTR